MVKYKILEFLLLSKAVNYQSNFKLRIEKFKKKKTLRSVGPSGLPRAALENGKKFVFNLQINVTRISLRSILGIFRSKFRTSSTFQ